MPQKSIFTISQEEKQVAVEKLVERSALRGDFLLMLVLSTIIVTIGILLGNTSILIGGMLLTPLLFPPLGLALSVVTNNSKGIMRGVKNILSALAVVLVVAFLISLFFFREKAAIPLAQLESFADPSLLFLFVAIASGIGAAFAISKPQLSEALPGVAIAVALLPPLAMISVGLSRLSFVVMAGALQLFLINIVGIVFGSIVVFSLMGFFPARKVEQKEIKQEEKEKEAEKEKVQAKE